MKSLLLPPIFFLSFCVLALSSCSKSNEEEKIVQTNAIIQFSVSGITDVVPSATAMKQRDNAKIQNPIQHVVYKDFETLNYYKDGVSSLSLGKKMATTTMKPGVKYRVEIYEKNGTTEKHWRTLNLTSNTSVSLSDTVGVVYGKTYRWYAYSYNTSDAINVAPQSLDIPMGINKDFIYASDELKISQYGNTGINIVFKRKTAQIAIDVDGRGSMANAITALQVVFPAGLLKTGNFNLKDEEVVMSSLTNLSVSDYTLDLNEFHNVYDSETYRKRFYLHSVAAIPNQSTLNLTVNSFTINVNNGLTTGNSTATRNLTGSGALTFSYPNVAMAIGSSGTLKIDALESGLVYAGTTWARSNLYRHSATGYHRYRFYPDNIQTNDPRSYFSFKGYIPLTLTERTNAKDACALVYPAGRWMTPLKTDLDKIVGSYGLVSNLLNVVLDVLSPSTNNTSPIIGPNNNSGNYIRYSGAVSSSGSNSLFSANSSQLQFPFNGFHVVADLVNFSGLTLLEINLGDTYGRNAAFWTYEEGVNLLGLVGVGAWGYLARIREPITVVVTYPAASFAYGTASLLSNVNVPGFVDVLSTDFKNIRCIRNTGWEAASKEAGYSSEPTY